MRFPKDRQQTGGVARILTVLASALLIGAACTSIEEDPPPEEEPGAGEETAGEEETEPVEGGTLRVGRIPDIVSPDGHVLGAVNHTITNSVYGRLISYGEGFEPQPMLAESVDINDDATEFTITLREGIAFHDGTPITSETIVANLERIRDPETGAAQLQGLANAANAQTPDERTVVLSFDVPTRGALDLLNLMAIVDPETIDGTAPEGLVVNGSGPYRFIEWAQGERIVLERNDDYWDPDRPLLDGIEFDILGDAAALVVQLEADAIDVAEWVQPEDAARLADAGYGTVVDASDMYYITVNVASPPFDDVRVRQAINYAIDRERFVEESLAGFVEPTSLAWPTFSPAHDDEDAQRYAFDLERAEELLTEAGVSGETFELVVNAAQPPLSDLAQILQSDLAGIGVDIEIQPLDPPQWRPLAFDATYENMISGPYGAGMLPASQFLISRPLTWDNNFSNFESDEYQQLVEAANQAAAPDEVEESLTALREFMLDEAFIMPVASNPQVIVHDSSVAGIEARLGGGYEFGGASLQE